MRILKLYFQNEYLGEIQGASVEGMWMNGRIIPSKNMNRFKDFFAEIVNEESVFAEIDDKEGWLEEDNWFVVDKENGRRGICLPAIYHDGEINWRWR
ncbi:hypothetical protein [Aneurinibacillus migulanus]|uniref:hypothetical protein n=1 Tax=Aneurinibacillus migulanus TaxID=47500 RepID=UPI003B969FFD